VSLAIGLGAKVLVKIAAPSGLLATASGTAAGVANPAATIAARDRNVVIEAS
jgi:hypothetical protein